LVDGASAAPVTGTEGATTLLQVELDGRR